MLSFELPSTWYTLPCKNGELRLPLNILFDNYENNPVTYNFKQNQKWCDHWIATPLLVLASLECLAPPKREAMMGRHDIKFKLYEHWSTLWLKHYDSHFTADIFWCSFADENVWYVTFLPMCATDTKSTWVQIMARWWTCDRPQPDVILTILNAATYHQGTTCKSFSFHQQLCCCSKSRPDNTKETTKARRWIHISREYNSESIKMSWLKPIAVDDMATKEAGPLATVIFLSSRGVVLFVMHLILKQICAMYTFYCLCDTISTQTHIHNDKLMHIWTPILTLFVCKYGNPWNIRFHSFG